VVLADFAGVAIEHALRFSRTEARRQDLQRTVDGLGAMAEFSRALAGETDWRAILELVAKRGRALVSARALAIELPADGELEVAAAAGELPPSLVGQRMPLQGSVAHAALTAKRPLRFEDQLNRVRHREYGLGRLGFKAQAGLVVPLGSAIARSASCSRSTGSTADRSSRPRTSGCSRPSP
jgi:hypothetical protein